MRLMDTDPLSLSVWISASSAVVFLKMTVMDTDSLLFSVGKFVSSAVVSFIAVKYCLKYFMNQLDNENKMAYDKLKKIGIGKNELKLNKHELKIAANLIVPSELEGSWSNIAGLDGVKVDLNQTVIFPMKHRDKLNESGLLKPPKGILLFGPPGCGKTLVAKATAKEAGVSFISLDASCLIDKWYGESPKLANATFTLAEKLQPCIIFIDEIDSLLRSRSSSDHEATAQLKSIFLAKWDGLETDKTRTVIVMGATNRPEDIDPAISRRMPKKFKIPLPNTEARLAVLKLHLAAEEHEVREKQLERLAELTEDFSCNNLEELCREAATLRLTELNPDRMQEEIESLRRINIMDCLKVVADMKETMAMMGQSY